MSPLTKYVPVLLTRAGERDALERVPADVRAALLPLFAVHPRPWADDDAEVPPLEAHIGKLPAQLVKAWGTGRAFVDTAFLDNELMSDGQHPLTWLVQEAQFLGLELVPVTGPGRTDGDLTAAAMAALMDDRGVCLRLMLDDLDLITNVAAMDELLSRLDVSPAVCDVVLDFGASLPVLGGAASVVAQTAINNLPYLDEWRSLAVVGCSMPSPLPTNDTVVERLEWALHRRLTIDAPAHRLPMYGDYGIADAGPTPDVDPKLLTIKSSLRYTTLAGSDIYVARGGLFKASGGRGVGGAASFSAAQTLRSLPTFGPTTHCDFERWISDTADEAPSGGSPKVWRELATLHHLTAVTEDLATLHGA